MSDHHLYPPAASHQPDSVSDVDAIEKRLEQLLRQQRIQFEEELQQQRDQMVAEFQRRLLEEQQMMEERYQQREAIAAAEMQHNFKASLEEACLQGKVHDVSASVGASTPDQNVGKASRGKQGGRGGQSRRSGCFASGAANTAETAPPAPSPPISPTPQRFTRARSAQLSGSAQPPSTSRAKPTPVSRDSPLQTRANTAAVPSAVLSPATRSSRARTEPPPLSSSPRPQSQAPPLPNQVKAPRKPSCSPQKPPERPASHVHRLMAAETDSSQKIVKDAFFLHCRLLWGLVDAASVPQPPPVDLVTDFNHRFTNMTSLRASAQSTKTLILPNMVEISSQVRSAGSVGFSKTRKQLIQVEEHLIEYFQAYCARFGLRRWCPDLTQSAYSLWNAAHRIVAMATFKHALVANGYEHLGPSPKYAQDNVLLLSIYDHFVHHLQALRYKQEQRNPGSVASSASLNTIYQNRSRLSVLRTKFLREFNYPARYIAMTEDPKANSDDEYDPTTRLYNIKCKPERSAAANLFYRRLDPLIIHFAQIQCKRTRFRTRVVPTVQQNSLLKGLPRLMPLDWYDPAFFNSLPPKIQHTAANIKLVAFPPHEDLDRLLSRPPSTYDKMADVKFVRHYYKQLAERYELADRKLEKLTKRVSELYNANHDNDNRESEDEGERDEDDTDLEEEAEDSDGGGEDYQDETDDEMNDMDGGEPATFDGNVAAVKLEEDEEMEDFLLANGQAEGSGEANSTITGMVGRSEFMDHFDDII